MKGKTWRIAVAFILVASLLSAMVAVASATGEGVTQVSVSVSPDEINPNGTTTIKVTVVTANADPTTGDAWTGTLEVTEPDGDVGEILGGISGTGTITVTKVYPTDFSLKSGTALGTGDIGTYNITATANISGQSAVTGTGSFEVKDYYLTVSAGRIVKGGTTTITVNTPHTTDWTGTITVTRPDTTTATASVSPASTSKIYPTDFAAGGGNPGAPSTADAGVYSISLSVTAGTTDPAGSDTGTFDVQNPSPHLGTGFTATTDACAACHRAHTAAGPKILKSSTQKGMCESCHDGTGANTKVTDGIYLGSTEGTQEEGLRGGGFTNAKMDTNLDGTVGSASVTSRHTVGAASPVVWGSGALGDNDAGETISELQCGNCHNPHGNSQYRLLRPKPTGLVTDAPATGVTVPDESPKNYTISYDANNYRDLGKYPTGVLSQMTEWCGQCHQRYEADAGSGSTARGDTVFTYSHMTEGIGGECLKCHVAHGTSATMSSYAAATDITWPGGTTPTWQGTESNYSRLLHIDNRGVCLQCHPTTALTQN